MSRLGSWWRHWRRPLEIDRETAERLALAEMERLGWPREPVRVTRVFRCTASTAPRRPVEPDHAAGANSSLRLLIGACWRVDVETDARGFRAVVIDGDTGEVRRVISTPR